LSVFACLPGFGFSAREKFMIAWAGLRGSVPIILAMFLLSARISQANVIFHLVFFVTFISVLIQGSTIPWVAKKLGVDLPYESDVKFPIEFNPSVNLKNSLHELTLTPGARAVGKSLLDLRLPKDVLVVLIQRRGDILVPRGGTEILE